MNETLKKSILMLVQAVVTAALVFLESIMFPSCISAGGDVQQTNDVYIQGTIEMSDKLQSVYHTRHIWRDDDLSLSVPRPKIKYDNIVDDKDFAALKSSNRLSRLNQEGAGQGKGKGVYDYQKGKIPDFNKTVSDDIIALRSGLLDKADVDTIKRALENQNSKDLDRMEKERIQNKLDEISRQRQEFIDKELGFSPTSNEMNA